MLSYSAISRLVPQNAFRLEIPDSHAEPLSYLRNALLPLGFDFRESISWCPELSNEGLSRRKAEWETYKKWRQALAIRHCLEDPEVAGEDEQLGFVEDLEITDVEEQLGSLHSPGTPSQHRLIRNVPSHTAAHLHRTDYTFGAIEVI